MRSFNVITVATLALGVGLMGCSKSDNDADKSSSSIPAVESAEEGIDLVIQWPVGKKYTQRFTLEEQNRLQLPGRPNPLVEQVSLTQDYTLSVLSQTEADGPELEETILNSKLDINVNGRSVLNLNTARRASTDDATTPEDIFRTIVGKNVVVRLDATNQIVEVTGSDEIKKTVISQLPPQARSILGRVFSQNYYGQLAIVDHLRGLHHPNAKPGDSWSSEVEIETGSLAKALLKLTFTFEKMETRRGRSCALLSFQGDMQSTDEPGTGPMGMKSSIKNGTVSGRSWFDAEMGMVRESEVKQTIDMTMTMDVPRIGNKGGGNQTMANTLTQTSRSQLLEVGDLAP